MPTSGGGQVVTLADGLKRNWGGSWGPDGRIVFHSQSGGEGLSRVSALGGPTEVLTKPDAAAGENSHRWPQVLPDGDGIVFTVWKGSADASQIGVPLGSEPARSATSCQALSPAISLPATSSTSPRAA